MSPPRLASLLLLGLVLVGSGALSAKDTLLRMPSPVFALPADGQGLAKKLIREQLEVILPPGSRLIFDSPVAPGGVAGGASTTGHEPVPVSLSVERYPVIDMTDNLYAPLDQRYVPVMIDWFEALLAEMKITPTEARAHGLLANKVARLMRVFVGIRMHRDHKRDLGMAPAIGWCRIYFREDWGRYKQGETHALVLVATDAGWQAIDPYTRRIRTLSPRDERWFIEFIVL